MFDGDITKGAVVVDDPQLVLTFLGVRRKAVGRECIGNLLQGRA